MRKKIFVIFIIALFIVGCVPQSDEVSKKTTVTQNARQEIVSLDNLYLSIRPISFKDGVGPNIVYEKLNEDLIIVLKDNNPDIDPKFRVYSYVLEQDLPKYKVPKDELFKIALSNFEEEEFPLNILTSEDGIAIAIFPIWNESFMIGEDIVQSHLLSESSLSILRDQLGEEYYIRISNWGVFMAFRKYIPEEAWDGLRNIALEAYQNEMQPLSDKLFLYKEGKIITVKDEYPS
ncbi:hypothetical protein HYV81_03480 [Candidatus Woesearchaeota archaeon]|nr:hypothetical protein [Candidatus Woesearchaeota archaeon]